MLGGPDPALGPQVADLCPRTTPIHKIAEQILDSLLEIDRYIGLADICGIALLVRTCQNCFACKWSCTISCMYSRGYNFQEHPINLLFFTERFRSFVSQLH